MGLKEGEDPIIGLELEDGKTVTLTSVEGKAQCCGKNCWEVVGDRIGSRGVSDYEARPEVRTGTGLSWIGLLRKPTQRQRFA